MPQVLLRQLQDNPSVIKLNQEKGPLPLSSLIAEALVISASYLQKKRPILVVKNSLYQAQRLYDRVASFLGEEECALFSADESLRVEAIASSPETRANKVETLSSLIKNPNQVVITCPSGLLRQLPSPELFQENCIALKVNDTVDIEQLKRKLRASGYFQTSHIDQPLSFASRGGILDVYSINYDQPIRIEFFDDEIESIRFFDAITQKTIVPIEKVEIVPASDFMVSEEDIKEIKKKSFEILEKEEDVMLRSSVEVAIESLEQGIREPSLYPYLALLSKTSGLYDYMKDPLIILSDKSEIEENIKRFETETITYIQEMVQEKKLLPRYTMWHDFSSVVKKHRTVEEDPYLDNVSHIEELFLPSDSLALKLKLLGKEKQVLVCLEDKDMERILNTCVEEEIPYVLLQEEDELQEGIINILRFGLYQGFTLQDFTVASANELLEIKRHVGRYEKKFRSAEVIHNYDELEKGDYIVHAQYGVGQYFGIETREVQNTTKDFLKIIYRGNSELLVPLEQFRLVRKFVSREGVVPRLNKLGSDEWAKTKKRLEENVTDIAERLVQLYATRTEDVGYAFAKDNEYQKKFEDEFPFELTPDQAQAVIDIKKDMEKPKPMDRLVCGDVGFGKTEIAVRASFKAVSENKQVAVLCPTTILSEQHYRTFLDRYKNYPFTIKVLNRYVTPKEVKQRLKELKEGKIDILIGTHRILSKDVEFHDLGLLVVDEEQRFGVEHKERIKEMKVGVDVLTLSATPIPRTLQMSLIGIRQLSQLETPPANRYNVQTYVAEKNQGLIVSAIEKELSRNGQVFYLYNNIEEIYSVARNLQSSIKEAKIGVIHGQMDRELIEDTMMRFTNRELNVLVCTTIIENGIDIPNANTMIIDNAHRFGLAQIYQIKGRVGRSDRVAYAYLLVPPHKQLNETAQKRLQAVKEFARLGSGYKIAMRDLTIRGTGDLLGAEQSGFIDTVGIDMYIEMLEEAIEKKKGTYVPKPENIQHTNISEDGYIPKNFTPDDFDTIQMYQTIDLLSSLEELSQYKQEVIDQYGKLPDEVEMLFQKRKLDLLVAQDYVEKYREIKDQTEITFTKEFSDQVDGVKLFELFTKISKDIEIRYRNQTIIAYIPKVKNRLNIAMEVITQAKEAKKDES